MIINLILVLLTFGSTSVHGQAFRDVTINFELILSEADEPLPTEENIEIEVFRCYVTNLQFLKGSEVVFAEPSSAHLIDMNDDASMTVSVDVPPEVNYTHLRFDIGVDSATNVGGAMGGALDPMHGMYWTWKSGYINFKLEGNADHCPARGNRFTFHLGGYRAPHAMLRSVQFQVDNRERINLSISVPAFLQAVDLVEVNSIMSPSATAGKLADLLPNMFSLSERSTP